MKGVVLSFEALLGLAVLFFLVLVVNSNLAGIEKNPFADTYLRELSLDASTVLEKSGKLELAVSRNDSSRLRQFLNQLPTAICMEVLVYRSTDLNAAIFGVAKAGCQSPASIVSLNRTFVARQNQDANFFLARVNAWRQS